MDNVCFNEAWYFLGGRKFNSRDTGAYLGLEVWLQNSSTQPPIKVTCMCDESTADNILRWCPIYRPICKTSFSVRWSSRKKKWYMFVENDDFVSG